MEPTYSLDVSAHGTSAQCVELAWSCMKYSSLLEGRELQRSCGGVGSDDMRTVRGSAQCVPLPGVNQAGTRLRLLH